MTTLLIWAAPVAAGLTLARLADQPLNWREWACILAWPVVVAWITVSLVLTETGGSRHDEA